MARVVADLQADLHALDADAFRRSLTREGLAPQSFTFDAHLGQLADRAARHALAGLADGIDWLVQRRPAPGGPHAVCHGDFHPYNVLMAADRVTGVLDWPHAIVADAAFDVATTLTILRHVPSELFDLPVPLRWLTSVARPLLVAGYLRRYRRRRGLDRERLGYYEAAACMKVLVEAGQVRLAPAGTRSSLFASAYTARAAGRFRAVTGIAPLLPALRVT